MVLGHQSIIVISTCESEIRAYSQFLARPDCVGEWGLDVVVLVVVFVVLVVAFVVEVGALVVEVGALVVDDLVDVGVIVLTDPRLVGRRLS